MMTLRKGLFWAGLLTLCCSAAQARPVYLQDGGKIEVQKVWQEGDRIYLLINRDSLIYYGIDEIDLQRTGTMERQGTPAPAPAIVSPPAAKPVVEPPPAAPQKETAPIPVTKEPEARIEAPVQAPAPPPTEPVKATPVAKPEKPAAAAKGPETISFEARNGNVLFPHRLHQENAGACSECHAAAPGKIAGFNMKAAHALCRGCHEKNGVSAVKCADCHKKTE